MGRPAINLKEKRFGKLTVVERIENIPKHHARWLCNKNRKRPKNWKKVN